MLRWLAVMLALLAGLALPAAAADPYDLWLPPQTTPPAAALARVETAPSPTADIARTELARALPDGVAVRLSIDPALPANDEGYRLRSQPGGRIEISARRDIGLLYGAFDLIRRWRTAAPTDALDVLEQPAVRLRLLNHWDNPDRFVERGYAGQSIWDWWKLPDHADGRYADYARANASIGINGAVLNNVNAKAIQLTPEWIAKAAKLADIFRPFGVRVYLSARWSSPMEIGGLKTADPLDPAVAQWWRDKADEIYRAIPDFGGFLVKANSEGQPGPGDYGRSHVEGANMLARALKPHGGVVMWRAFVYSEHDQNDRHKQAYAEFRPLDGKFDENVIVQVKNGAIDFQPREPFHPLFGAMPKTPLMLEVQITKEYLGFATHLVFLGPMWEEVLQSDTMARGPGSTVARVIDGSLEGHGLTGMAGVANIGTDRNWSGSVFNQANWYAFGRLAWNPALSGKAIADEWTRQTFGNDPHVVGPVVAMMLGSRQAAVDYMAPLGLAHLMATGHHYGPAPWVADLARPEWNPAYYHRADAQGIGFDRTATGSGAVSQYAPAVAARFADRKRVGDDYLLWFHHVGWSEKLPSGRTMWAELVARYDRGVAAVAAMQAQWAALEPYVDAPRFAETRDFLAIQHREAQWWRDASIAYFASVSGRPLPPGVAPPPKSLREYQAVTHPDAPGNP